MLVFKSDKYNVTKHHKFDIEAMSTMNHAKSERPPAVIAGAYQTGVLGVRSLKRRGIRALCFDCDRTYPGFRSIYGPAHHCPDPDKHPDAWFEFMLKLARELGEKAALIPSSDQFVTAISRYSNELKDYFIFSPGIDLQGMLSEKQTQYEIADRYGMPMPKTQYVNSLDEVREFSKSASFPCLIKPKHFREWRRFSRNHPLYGRKITIAQTKQQLIENYQLASEVSADVIVQEIIQGDDTQKRVYLSCYDKDSRRIANAMFRELRCYPIGFGPATVSEPVIDPEADKVCDRFLKEIGYVGVCEIEMKWDTRDGCIKLIEVNPRLSGGGDAAPYDGVDIPWIHYLDLIGERFNQVVPKGNDFRHIVLRSDAETVPVYWKAGLIRWRDLIRTYRPPIAFFDLDSMDLRYSTETICVSVRSLLRGLMRNLIRRR